MLGKELCTEHKVWHKQQFCCSVDLPAVVTGDPVAVAVAAVVGAAEVVAAVVAGTAVATAGSSPPSQGKSL